MDVRNGAIGGSTGWPCPGSAARCMLRAVFVGVPARAWATLRNGVGLGLRDLQAGEVPPGLGLVVRGAELCEKGMCNTGCCCSDSCKKGSGKAQPTEMKEQGMCFAASHSMLAGEQGHV